MEYEGEKLKMTDKAKFLGILMDSALSWTPHIENLSKRLKTGLYILKQLNQVVREKLILHLSIHI